MTTLSPALLDPTTSCGILTAADGRTLPLGASRLVVRAAGGLARVQLVQMFANPYAEPLHVTYQLALPADAAVGGFAFRLGMQRIVGTIDRRAAARERFEQAIASGRTAALLEQDRTAVFTQELGNLPPHAEVEATIEIDQPLAWVDGGWQFRFPTTVAPRYLGAEGRVADAARIAGTIADPMASMVPPRCELDLVVADAIAGGAAPVSPSHALHCQAAAGGMRVAFAAEAGRVAMDRDVVVAWTVAAPQPGVALQTLRTAAQAFGLLTLVPPLAAPTGTRFPRDLVVLLDISGSMSGAPLAQAQHVTSELIRSLTDADRLELLAFSSRTSAWQREPVAATAANRAAAEGWVRGLQASGGTEMHTAILQALAAVRAGVQRQIVLVTDGLIGFENEIVRAIRSGLPTGSRVHVVGVGSAPNRTLTRGASRAGHGIEVLIGLDEAPTAAAARLLARTAAPLVQDLVLSGSALLAAAPHALPDLFAGAPARLALQLRPEGGTLRVRGAGPLGAFVHELVVPPLAVGGEAAIARAFAREAVEDLEVELAATGAQQDVDARIEQLGLAHGIATRLTSWIAVAEQPAVDPRAVQRSVVVPNELPYGMAIEQLGLRAAGGACMAMPASMSFECAKTLASPPPPPAAPRGRALPSADDASFEMREEAAPREQERAAPKKRKDSLLRRMLDAVGGAKDAAGGKGEGGAGGGGPRATLRLQNASEWVFELTGLATWHAPVRVVVVFADGSERELAVDPARTTAAAPLTVAMLVRLVLLPDGAAPQRPVRLRLEQAGAILDVSVA